MSLLSRLPLVALLVAFVVFTLTLVLVVSSGVGMAQPFNLLLILLLAASVILMFLAQNPHNENAALMLWFGAGVWGAAAYLDFMALGLPALVVGVLATVSAFGVERESRAYSFIGPALLIGLSVALVIIANLLAR
ncbi:MAG: hypothetical protein HY741_24415 [Chloroflexi bacterium]|nr:hypothetical protein [Chloroflexota bacterium]